jgi:hypothetical protein
LPDDFVSNFEYYHAQAVARLARLRDMTVEDMNAQPCMPLSTELACKELATIAAPALLKPHNTVVCAEANPADTSAVKEDQLIAAFVAEDLRKIAAGEALSEPPKRAGMHKRKRTKTVPAAPDVSVPVSHTSGSVTPVEARALLHKLQGCTIPDIVGSQRAEPVVGTTSTDVSGTATTPAAADELMFRPDLFSAVQNQLKHPCTVDACASDGGGNALLASYYSPCNSFVMLWLTAVLLSCVCMYTGS